MGARNNYVPLLQPPTTPLPSVGLFPPMIGWGASGLYAPSSFTERTKPETRPEPPLSFFSSLIVFFFSFSFFSGGENPLPVFPRGIGFPFFLVLRLGSVN